MKKIKIILAGLFILFLSQGILAQQAGPPDPPGSHGSENDQLPGGSAPVGNGLFVLLGLGIAYGGGKTYFLIKK